MTIITSNKLDSEIELARKLFWLISRDYIFFSSFNENINTWDDGAYPCVNCSDIFVSGADAESLHLEEVDKFILVCKKYPKFAEYAWCIAKRNQDPWKTAVTSEEQEAVNFARQLLETNNEKT